MRRRAYRTAAIAAAAMTGAAGAQEAMYTRAATMPNPGAIIVRPQVMISRYGLNPITGAERTTTYEFVPSVQIGLVRDLSLTFEGAAGWKVEEQPDESNDTDRGVGDIDALLKWRYYKNDTGALDTFRAALLGGAEIPSGDDHDFSSDSVDPMIGAVATLVRGRHGFNQDVMYTINTGGDAATNLGGEGPDDALHFNSAYVFRLAPAISDAQSGGAWYATAEMNGLYETNGDIELRLAPGVMYEAPGWAFEVMGQLPLWHELDERPELDWSVGVGVRVRF